jgi:dTDP-4-amino-4,6-dideoxygalactose transaminase
MTTPFVPFNDLGAQYRRLQAPIDEAVKRVLASGYYIGGPELESFERAFAGYVGRKHAVGVANGTDAIALALRALDVGPSSEVIVPAVSAYPSTVGIVQAGASPVFVDVDPTTGFIDDRLVERAVTPRARAIMPVHLFGSMPDERVLAQLVTIARAHGLHLVEDCAQAQGAAVGAHRAGHLGSAAAWSFYPTKNLGAIGDAGAVTTDSDELAARLRRLRNYGQKTRYEHVELGFNSRLDPLQAAILAVKLVHLEHENARRRTIAQKYDEAFANLHRLCPVRVASGAKPNRHLYPVLLADSAARGDFQRDLENAGVQTLIHYPIPMPDQLATPEVCRPKTPFTNARVFCDRVVSLPLYPDLTDRQVAVVIAAVSAWDAQPS